MFGAGISLILGLGLVAALSNRMSDRLFEFRCPIHGFVTLNAFERDLISHEYFQRLRRIRQLAWTDIVYPGAMHTRFEHSLGVMHVATRMFDEIWKRKEEELKAVGFHPESRARDRAVLRAIALLHDIGHSPFSHAGEELMPLAPNNKVYKHEAYSSALIRSMSPLIDEHKDNKLGFKITAAEIGNVLDGKVDVTPSNLFWRQLVSSQLDADRADYLLRDSHHIGVQYGLFDLERLLISLTVARDPETDDPVLAVEEGGWHTAEALILARYMMFSQVYFHKTRSIYDKHLSDALREILKTAQAKTELQDKLRFPPPTSEADLAAYSKWDDWRVLGLLHDGEGGEAGERLRSRNHYRLVYELGTIDMNAQLPNDEKKRFKEAEKRYQKVTKALVGLVAHEDDSARSWYKPDGEIMIAFGPDRRLIPLSEVSPLVRSIKRQPGAERVMRLYVKPENRDKADKIVKQTLETTKKA